MLVDAGPLSRGAAINDALPVVDGEVPLPDWSAWGEEELAGLTGDLRARMPASRVRTHRPRRRPARQRGAAAADRRGCPRAALGGARPDPRRGAGRHCPSPGCALGAAAAVVLLVAGVAVGVRPPVLVSGGVMDDGCRVAIESAGKPPRARRAAWAT